MKKRISAMALALALCLGLAVPALAAEEPPALTVTVSGPDGESPGEAMEFSLRSVTEEFVADNRYSAIHTVFTRGEEAKPVNVENAAVLTLGSKVTVDGLRTDQGSGPWDTVSLYAWSDPDGDGVYDQWLFSYYRGQNGITQVPLSQPGPFIYYEIDYNEGKQVYSLAADVCGDDTLAYYGNCLSLPSSWTLSAEFLTRLFGPDTLIQLKVFTRGAYGDSSNPSGVVEGPSSYYYIPKGQALPPEFTDVPAWCADAVNWAAQSGVTTGATPTTFAPGKDCTQVQILTFLWRAQNKPTATAAIFSNLAGEYAPAANWAYEQGFIDDSFTPGAPCTRAQAVSYIWQAFERPEAAAGSFTDVDAGEDYAKAVDWAVENGIVEGYTDGTFGPGKVCSRGAIAAMLYRAFVEEARLTGK